MAADIKIAGATYSSVPRIDVATPSGTDHSYYDCTGAKELTENGTFDVTGLASVLVNVAGGGGLPSGVSAVAFGEDTVSEDYTTAKRTVTHNMGATPDLILYFHEGNIATTYTMLFILWSPLLAYRSSGYKHFFGYHGNSTTSVTVSNSGSTTVGIMNVGDTTFQITSSSSSNYWRAGTYKWIAIKF